VTVRALRRIALGALLLAAVPSVHAQTPEASFEVTRVRVSGHTVFTTEELHLLVAPAEGRRLALAELEAFAARITERYVGAGYLLARATVPPQDVVDGVVEIRVVEGTIGRVDVRGARRYDPELLRSYFRFRDPPVFDAAAIDRGLLLLNDLPGLTVAATLNAGQAPGTTDVVLDVTRERWFSGSLELDNYGAAATGRERFGMALNFNNPFGIGDVISLRGLVTLDDLDLERVAYAVPLGRWGTKLEASYTHVRAEAGGAAVAGLGIVGSGHLANVVVTHPVVRERALTLVGIAGFLYKDLETTVLNDSANRDRLRVASAGAALDVTDAWRGRTSGLLTLHQGIGDLFDGQHGDHDRHASRVGAGGTFTKLTADTSRLQGLGETTALFVRGSGQWSSRRLDASEQFIVGGQGTVRGYPLAEASGDWGYAVTVELRWNAPGFADRPAFFGKTWGDLLQVFVFTDHGGIVVKDPAPGGNRVTDLTGAGLGTRFVIPERLSVALEYAKPVDGPRPSDRRQDVFYFQVIVPF
jgi:hemolysin activation/secretion protein